MIHASFSKTIIYKINKIKDDSERISHWLNANKLVLNVEKAKWMIVNRTEIDDEISPEVSIANAV